MIHDKSIQIFERPGTIELQWKILECLREVNHPYSMQELLQARVGCLDHRRST